MIDWWWSWLLAAIGIAGIWLQGDKRLIGWLIGIGVQVLWITYALATGQHGFVVMSLAYGGVYLRNLIKWKREQKGAAA